MMKKIFRSLVALFAIFVASVCLSANVPAVHVIVKQGAKVVKQVKTDTGGNFAVGSLPEGPYTLEFRAADKSSAMQNQQFSIAVDGIKSVERRSGISGRSLVGGVALNVTVKRGGNVTGQVDIGEKAAQKKKKVWIPPMLGSNMPGRWVEEGSPEHHAAKGRGAVGRDAIQKMQDKGYNPQG